MAGCRFLLASLLIFFLRAVFRQYKVVTRKQIKNAMIAGTLFLTIGNGGVSWALQFLDSGFAALLISAQPLVMILMMWMYDKKPLPLKTWIGVVLGILGVYLLVSQSALVSQQGQVFGLAVVFLCLVGWGIASIFTSKVDMPKSYFTNSAIQMLVGGLSLITISLFIEDLTIDWRGISSTAWYSLAYLVVFGSVIAFTSFNFLLQHVSPEKVATSTYVNPIVAMILGFYFRNEVITTQSMIASGILLIGVYFINMNKPRKLKKL
jgi:drug/metabolite transporter (DMT)-like permease